MNRRVWLAAALCWTLPVRAAESLPQRRFAVPGMRGVVLRLPGDLVLTQGGHELLVVQAEAHVLDRIELVRQQDVLVIAARAPGFQTRKPIRLSLTLRDVRSITNDTAGSIRADALSGDRLSLTQAGSGSLWIGRLRAASLTVLLDGSGDVEIGAGSVQHQDVTLDGSGDYLAAGMHSAHARVAAQGSGSARIRAQDTLHAILTGSGDIAHQGGAKVTSQEDGAGELIELREP